MDYLAHLFHGGIVRKEGGLLDEVEIFDMSPYFTELFLCVKKSSMVISLKGRFVSGESREYYMLMPLHNDGH